MGRLVEHEKSGPYRLDESDVDPEKGDIAICQCGLSRSFPFCDGTHRETESEDTDACYRYVANDGDLVRKEVARVVYEDGTTEDLQ